MDTGRDAKTRVRSGCLTCRARRIKCDESKPECHRCRASHVECLGYEQKRRVVAARSRALRTWPPEGDDDTVQHDRDKDSNESHVSLSALHGSTGLPLVCLPSNPLPYQRPHDSARHILAYHQYIFRTVSVLAPPAHLFWWRDYLCQQAWELEHLYNAIIALGTIHRAVVLASGEPPASQRHGQDTTINAIRTYTKAPEQLASFLGENGPDISTVATTLLLAYFECFAGNVLAAYRHIKVANYHVSSLSILTSMPEATFMSPITSSLKALNRVCRIALPLPGLGIDVGQLHLDSDIPPSNKLSTCTIHLSATCSCNNIHEVLEIGSSSPEIEALIWDPLAASTTSISVEKISAFTDTVRDWMRIHADEIPQLDPDKNGESDTPDGHIAFDLFQIPPEPYAATSVDVCLVGALCEYYLARIEWRLSFVYDKSKIQESSAYTHCHRALAWIHTASTILRSGNDRLNQSRLACERLNGGFLPILFMLGQMSPRMEWLRWTMGQMKSIGREGLLRGTSMSEALGALPAFETSCISDIPSLLDSWPPPNARSVCILLPDCDGGGHRAYYARPKPAGNGSQNRNEVSYRPLGTVKWAAQGGGSDRTPDLSFYKSNNEHDLPLASEWLRSSEVAREWFLRNESPEFSLELALADHRNSVLLREVTAAMRRSQG